MLIVFFCIRKKEHGMLMNILLFIVILFWAYLISTGCLAPMEFLPGRKQSVRVSEPDKFLCTPLLRLMRKRKTEYVVLCKISCGGFYYWREQQQMKFRVLQERESSCTKINEHAE